jgi:hypothetical protein
MLQQQVSTSHVFVFGRGATPNQTIASFSQQHTFQFLGDTETIVLYFLQTLVTSSCPVMNPCFIPGNFLRYRIQHRNIDDAQFLEVLVSARGRRENKDLSMEELRSLWGKALVDPMEPQTTQIVNHLLETAPESLSKEEEDINLTMTYTSLQIAVMNSSSTEQQLMIRILETAHQTVTDNEGDSMLHFAAHNGASSEILRLIYKCNPDAAKSKNCHGKLPIHKLLYAFALKHAYQDTVDCVRFLLSVYEEAAATGDDQGKLPFHTLCQYYYYMPHEERHHILEMLFDAYPDAVRTKDKRKGHILVCRMGSRIDVDTIIFLLEKYPDAAVIQDSLG